MTTVWRVAGRATTTDGSNATVDASDATISLLEPLDLGNRETISSEIARRLVSYLLAGDIQPGDKIPSERKLADALGVGRSVVREALKSLALLGLIEVRQGDGTYLKRRESDLLSHSIEWGLMLGTKRVLDLVEARRALEVIIVGLAAARRDDADLAEMGRLIGEMEAASGAPDRFAAADIAFHLQISLAAKNDSLHQIMASIRALLTVWISRVSHSPGTYAATVEEHRAVYEGLVRGDADAARRAMTGHMDGATARLQATLERHDRPDAAEG